MELESKAIEAVAVTTGKAVDATVSFGKFARAVLGTVPEDLVGLVVGDRLRETRLRNLDRLQRRTDEIIQQRDAATIRTVSPNLAIPILKAAQDESSKEIQEIWARLLANAMDENRSGIRKDFVETINKLDPDDARVMLEIVELGGLEHSIGEIDLINKLGVTSDRLEVSLSHLKNIGCISSYGQQNFNSWRPDNLLLDLSAYGRELMRACGL